MIKEYKDERINKLIKESFERAIKDDEFTLELGYDYATFKITEMQLGGGNLSER